jgi:ADP-heptose:LPS heptosyltransferase
VNARPEKILALQFKYFGDAVLMTPALRAIRGHFPQCELHVLVPEEIAPLFQHLSWLNRIWAMPRRRGSASLTQTWPVIRALRRERFDRSVDFASNDRGAIVSFFVGARQRLGWAQRGGFFGRRFCYNQRVVLENNEQHESLRLAHVLSAWNIATPSSLEPEIRTDPALEKSVVAPFPRQTILCHVTTSNEKKQWPAGHWAALYQIARDAGLSLMLSTGRGVREQQFLAEIKKIVPDVPVVSPDPNLATFLVWLKRSAVFISGDTGPLHFAAGLGVPTISLFGPSSAVRWAPVGERHRVLTGSSCSCGASARICQSTNFCLAAISPEQVLNCLQTVLTEFKRS